MNDDSKPLSEEVCKIFDEDYKLLLAFNAGGGPLQQIERIVNSVAKDLILKVVKRISQQCEDFLKGEAETYPNFHYQFRNGFEHAAWLADHSWEIWHQGKRLDIHTTIRKAAQYVLSYESDILSQRLITAWFCLDEYDDKGLLSKNVIDLTEIRISRIMERFLLPRIERQIKETSTFVEAQRQESEKLWREQFKYEDNDYYCLNALTELHKTFPKNEYIQKAMDYAKAFMSKRLTDEYADYCISVVYRSDGETRYIEFRIAPDAIQIEDGGDSYDNGSWRLDAYSHTNDSCDVVPTAIELLNLGGHVEEEN